MCWLLWSDIWQGTQLDLEESLHSERLDERPQSSLETFLWPFCSCFVFVFLVCVCGFCPPFSLGACGKPVTEFGQQATIGGVQKIFLINKICLQPGCQKEE